MTIKMVRGFKPSDRYAYDYGVCSYANGWAQLDTRQDAWLQRKADLADRCLPLLQALARMTTPADEFSPGQDYDGITYDDVDEYISDLGDERLCSDASALWSVIDDARALTSGSGHRAADLKADGYLVTWRNRHRQQHGRQPCRGRSSGPYHPAGC